MIAQNLSTTNHVCIPNPGLHPKLIIHLNKYAHINRRNQMTGASPDLTVAAVVAALLVAVGNLDSQYKLQLHNYTY